MTLVDSGVGQSASAADDGVILGKTLKKKKSLTRLFSPASRKSARSRPPSPECPHTPPIPQVPKHFWPLGPSGAPRIPSMSFDSLMSGHLQDEQLDERKPGSPLAMSKTQMIDNPWSGTTAKCEPDIACQQSDVALNCNSTARASSVVSNVSTVKPIMHHSPTFPAMPKQANAWLRMPPAFTSVPRGRGASVTALTSKSPPIQPQLSRPSTAGGESIPKPTGKRKANSNKQYQDASSTSLFDLEDFSLSPWQATYSNDEIRSSFRSALTTSSSHIDTTSTERSSVLTKGTSITDSTIDQQSRPVSKADSMTVDDAIDMYAAGFDDDDDESGPNESRNTSMSEEERRRSTKIAEAIKDTIGDMRPSRRPTTSQSTSSTARMSYDMIQRESSQPPPILLPTSTRDQYGFFKASRHVAVPQYDAWTVGYLLSQERRTKKWSSYMRDQGLATFCPTRFPNRSTKTERYIRKGIPPAWRGPAWFFYAGGDTYLKKHAGLYTSLVSRCEEELSTTDKESIERDLQRTFPDNIHFKPDLPSRSSAAELPLLSSLRHVLRAYALHNPRIGYCQSLNFLAGLLLLFLCEEKAFWMLHIIATVYLPGTHELSLEGTNVDLWILMVALKSTLPHIWAKVGAAGGSGDDTNGGARLPPISLCTTSWFMSLFIGTLPIETVLRVWDVLFYEGSRTLFRVALTIFKLGEQRIKNVSDPMELFQIVQSLPRGMLDAGAFMATVCRRGGVGGEWVEARRSERREKFARERATATERSNGTGADDVAADSMSESARGRPPVTRMDSIWRRKTKTSNPVGVDGVSGVDKDVLAL